MPSGLRGYNAYLDETVKLNSTPIPEDGSFPVTGLDDGTDYSERITITAVDNAGNESAPVSLASLAVTATTAVAAPPPEDEEIEPLPAEYTAQIDAFAASYLKPNTKADGCIVGTVGPQGYYFRAYGGDRTSDGSPLTLADKFRYGSISKMYCSLLMMKEIGLGHVGIDDTLDMYPTLGTIPNGDKIKIRHLLMNCSGLKDYLQQDAANLQQYFLNPTSSFNAIAYIRRTPPLFEPGKMYSYSNSNWVLMGMILEWCDTEYYSKSRTIRQIVLEDCCQELGLDSAEWPTGNYLTLPYSRAWAKNEAYPIIQQYGILGQLFAPLIMPGVQTTPEIEWTAVHPSWGGAAGTLAGNMADLVKFGQKLAAGELLSEEMIALRNEETITYTHYTPVAEYSGPGWMGGGVGVNQWGHWWGWVGNLAGYIAVMWANPDNGAVVACMINHLDAAVDLANTINLSYRMAHLLYPETTVKARDQVVRINDAPASQAVAALPKILHYHAPGDEDANTFLPKKIPYYL